MKNKTRWKLFKGTVHLELKHITFTVLGNGDFTTRGYLISVPRLGCRRHSYLLCKVSYARVYQREFTLSFLSCRAYGKQGMTAVTRDEEAILQALIIISSSIKLSLISPQPLCTMYTSSPRTLSPISTLFRGGKKRF